MRRQHVVSKVSEGGVEGRRDVGSGGASGRVIGRAGERVGLVGLLGRWLLLDRLVGHKCVDSFKLKMK